MFNRYFALTGIDRVGSFLERWNWGADLSIGVTRELILVKIFPYFFRKQGCIFGFCG